MKPRFYLCLLLTALLLSSCSAGSGAGESGAASSKASGLPAVGIQIDPSASFPMQSSPAASAGSRQEETAATVPAEVQIRLATFNIKHCSEGLDRVAAVIRKAAPDIIGLQEVDCKCERSGYVDQPKELAEAAGYPYYRFIRAIDLQGGEYGTAILSRFPIVSFEITDFDPKGMEGRSLGHAVVDVKGISLDVYCTHLSYESREERWDQMKAIGKRLAGNTHYALLADLNTFVHEDIQYLKADYFVNRPDRPYDTFRRAGVHTDNIVLSKSFEELGSGTVNENVSDHLLLYASLLLHSVQ